MWNVVSRKQHHELLYIIRYLASGVEELYKPAVGTLVLEK